MVFEWKEIMCRFGLRPGAYLSVNLRTNLMHDLISLVVREPKPTKRVACHAEPI